MRSRSHLLKEKSVLKNWITNATPEQKPKSSGTLIKNANNGIKG